MLLNVCKSERWTVSVPLEERRQKAVSESLTILVVWDVAREVHFSPAAPRVLRRHLHYLREGREGKRNGEEYQSALKEPGSF